MNRDAGPPATDTSEAGEPGSGPNGSNESDAATGNAVLAGLLVEDRDRDDETTVADRTDQAEYHDELVDRLAALTVRRQTNQHRCTRRSQADPPCTHPDHRRDVDFTRHCLAMLGLPGEYPEVDQAAGPAGRVSQAEYLRVYSTNVTSKVKDDLRSFAPQLHGKEE